MAVVPPAGVGSTAECAGAIGECCDERAEQIGEGRADDCEHHADAQGVAAQDGEAAAPKRVRGCVRVGVGLPAFARGAFCEHRDDVNYYNELDQKAAAWLRCAERATLIKAAASYGLVKSGLLYHYPSTRVSLPLRQDNARQCG